ncbi:hypothetical protein PQX77_015361 [Marasmius sp. AFHP31]|nr:hypothetical protein PQX77_015361 [Marasmius sp. AFHP31]
MPPSKPQSGGVGMVEEVNTEEGLSDGQDFRVVGGLEQESGSGPEHLHMVDHTTGGEGGKNTAGAITHSQIEPSPAASNQLADPPLHQMGRHTAIHSTDNREEVDPLPRRSGRRDTVQHSTGSRGMVDTTGSITPTQYEPLSPARNQQVDYGIEVSPEVTQAALDRKDLYGHLTHQHFTTKKLHPKGFPEKNEYEQLLNIVGGKTFDNIPVGCINQLNLVQVEDGLQCTEDGCFKTVGTSDNLTRHF